MKLQTPVTIPKPSFSFSYSDEIMLFGSCFADEMGRMLRNDKFRVCPNPFGPLYNPCSILKAIKRLMCSSRYVASDLFLHDGLYHSFDHHSRFSSASETETLANINRQREYAADFLLTASRIIITFGTTRTYYLEKTGALVANCHKLPEGKFYRKEIQMESLVEEWWEVIYTLLEWSPNLCILLTVSPIRHWKDGAHENQLSKAMLLLLADKLNNFSSGRIEYFPAYEIMMDELRDYRFYAPDMIHPSAQAVEYIGRRFYESFLSPEAQTHLQQWQDIRKDIEHKPFHPDSEEYRKFARQTLLKVKELSGKFPYFDLSKEKELLHSKLK